MTPEVEASLKVAIRTLIYRSQVKSEAVATIVEKLSKEELTNQDWEILFNKEGADIAIEKEIYTPNMIRLLTLRALVIPETLPEFLQWLKIRKNKKLDEKQIVFLEFQKGISPLFPKKEVSKGIAYLFTQLVNNKISVDEVLWLLVNKDHQTIWGDYKKEVLDNIKKVSNLLIRKELITNLKIPKGSKSRRRLLLFVIGMGGIAVLSGLAGALALLAVSDSTHSTPLQQANLTPEQASVFARNPISGNGWQFSQLTRPVNILVMGMSVLPPDIQNPPDHTKNLGYFPQLNSFDGFSDVMLLIKFDPQTKKIVMLSIPRDTRAEIEGVGTKKLNSANVNGGPALTAKAISNLLGGVAIDRYIRINVLGVGKLIDALGGITVYVPKDMKYQDDSQHLYINLKAGKQHLSGDQALQLLRFRDDALGDIGRIQRQQMVLRALFEQSVNGATLARFPQILETIREHIDTNLSIEELIALLGFGTGTNRSNIEMLMLPGRFSENGRYGASYWIPDQQAIEKLAVKNFGLGASWMDTQETIDPSRLRIAIQDSTGEGQSVRGLINTLQQAGYVNVSRVSRGAGEPLETTHIVAQQGDSNSAESVRQVLGFGEVRVESTGDIGSDITIQVGRDWLRKHGIK